ncbi:NAD(P)-binding protein, partial [Aureobasidium melanogenum]
MSPNYKFEITPEKEASTRQYLYRQFFVTPPLVSPQQVDLTGKTAIVTGSNIGLGLECARQLLDLKLSKLILAVRSEAKGQKARADLLSGCTLAPSAIEIWNLDLSEYDSITKFAERAQGLDHLDIVVMNAGLYKVEQAFNSSTGFEEDIQVNYISTALLTILLLPILRNKRSGLDPGRLTIVSSDTAGWAKFKERNSDPILSAFKKTPAAPASWNMQERYSTSKLLGQFFLSELSNRLDPSEVIVNACNPGFCYGSDLQREGNGTILGFLVRVFTRVIGRTTSVGARSLTAAATIFGQEVHGQYVEDCEIHPMAPLIYEPEGKRIAEQLWEELLDELSFAGVQDIVLKLEKLEQWNDRSTKSLPISPNCGGIPFTATDAATNDNWNFCLAPTSYDASFDLLNMQGFDADSGTPDIGDLFSTDLTTGPRSSFPQWTDPLAISKDTDLNMICEPVSHSTSQMIDETVAGQTLTLDAWPIFECNPFVDTIPCPTTAPDHLRSLYSALSDQCVSSSANSQEVAKIEPFVYGTRDKLIAIVQRFSDKAQKIHGLLSEKNSTAIATQSSFILPPPAVLDSLLSACHRLYELHYPFLSAVAMRTNELLTKGVDPVITSLKLLLMMAAGAMTPAASDNHQIAQGLLEISRVFLNHIVEEDVRLVSNPDLLQCALGFNIVAAWSGDRWQMDASIYQKAMYIEMIRRSRLFEHRSPKITMPLADLTRVWQAWQEQESHNRTAYTWIILDQEMCLFQDATSTLFTSVTNFNASVPSSDRLWHATSAEQWAHDIGYHEGGTVAFPPSLDEHVRSLREEKNSIDPSKLTPTTLRLLLCHLQKVVSRVRALIADMTGNGVTSRTAHHQTAMVLISVHMDEARDMLRKWHDHASSGHTDADTPTMGANMILYHLISLNTLVNFPEIERIARSDKADPAQKPAHWVRSYHFDDCSRIFFHCGQILRTIRHMPEHTRPPWWAGAVYRVALIAWTNSMVISDLDAGANDRESSQTTTLVLDDLAADHPLVEPYLDRHQGIPVFWRSEGGYLALDVPSDILVHCADLLGVNPPLDFVRGVRQILLKLAARWQ